LRKPHPRYVALVVFIVVAVYVLTINLLDGS